MCIKLVRTYTCPGINKSDPPIENEDDHSREFIILCATPYNFAPDFDDADGTPIYGNPPCLSCLGERFEHYETACPDCSGLPFPSQLPVRVYTPVFESKARLANRTHAEQLLGLVWSYMAPHSRQFTIESDELSQPAGLDRLHAHINDLVSHLHGSLSQMACREDVSHAGRLGNVIFWDCDACESTRLPYRYNMSAQTCANIADEGLRQYFTERERLWKLLKHEGYHELADECEMFLESTLASIQYRNAQFEEQFNRLPLKRLRLARVTPFSRDEVETRWQHILPPRQIEQWEKKADVHSSFSCFINVMYVLAFLLAQDTGLPVERGFAVLKILEQTVMEKLVSTKMDPRMEFADDDIRPPPTGRGLSDMGERFANFFNMFGVDFLVLANLSNSAGVLRNMDHQESPYFDKLRQKFQESEKRLENKAKAVYNGTRFLTDEEYRAIQDGTGCYICGEQFEVPGRFPVERAVATTMCEHPGTHAGLRCLVAAAVGSTSEPACPLCRTPYPKPIDEDAVPNDPSAGQYQPQHSEGAQTDPMEQNPQGYHDRDCAWCPGCGHCARCEFCADEQDCQNGEPRWSIEGCTCCPGCLACAGNDADLESPQEYYFEEDLEQQNLETEQPDVDLSEEEFPHDLDDLEFNIWDYHFDGCIVCVDCGHCTGCQNCDPGQDCWSVGGHCQRCRPRSVMEDPACCFGCVACRREADAGNGSEEMELDDDEDEDGSEDRSQAMSLDSESDTEPSEAEETESSPQSQSSGSSAWHICPDRHCDHRPQERFGHNCRFCTMRRFDKCECPPECEACDEAETEWEDRAYEQWAEDTMQQVEAAVEAEFEETMQRLGDEAWMEAEVEAVAGGGDPFGVWGAASSALNLSDAQTEDVPEDADGDDEGIL